MSCADQSKALTWQSLAGALEGLARWANSKQANGELV